MKRNKKNCNIDQLTKTRLVITLIVYSKSITSKELLI